MLVTKERFEKYKRYLDLDEDVLIYAEAKDGQFVDSLFGEAFNVMVALTCIIKSFAEKQDMPFEEVCDDLKGMYKNYKSHIDGREY